MLRDAATAVVGLFGEGCEVVIHDLRDLDHSIVHIEGNVTSRRIGGCMTDLGLRKVRNGDFSNEYGYITRTDDGKILRSTSVFIRDHRGEPVGAFCINLDVGPFQAMQRALQFVIADAKDEFKETFSNDVEDMLERMLGDALSELGKPLQKLHREDKVAIIAALDDKGAFNLKRAPSVVGKKLGVSRFTVYNYLNEARASGQRRGR
jgi:predicted transcriptional regulator YheO